MCCHPNREDPLCLHHPKRMKSFFTEIMKLTPPPPKKKKKKKRKEKEKNKKTKIVHSTPEYKKNDIKFEKFLSTINMSICYPSVITSKI